MPTSSSESFGLGHALTHTVEVVCHHGVYTASSRRLKDAEHDIYSKIISENGINSVSSSSVVDDLNRDIRNLKVKFVSKSNSLLLGLKETLDLKIEKSFRITQSGEIELNPGPYEFDLEGEDDDSFEIQSAHINSEVFKKSYTFSQMSDCAEKLIHVNDTESFLSFFRSYPHIADKIDISSHHQSSMFKHSRMLIFIAIEIDIAGGKVHCIEGCDSEGLRQFNDIDLLFTLDGQIYGADVTSGRKSSVFCGKVYNCISPERESKINKIKTMSSSNRLSISPLVLTADFEGSQEVNLSFQNESAFFSKEFDIADHMIDEIQSMTIAEAETELDIFCRLELSKYKEDPSFEKFYKKDFSLDDKDILSKIAHHCSINVGYESLLRDMSKRFPNSTASLIEHIDRLDLKPQIKFPRFKISDSSETYEAKMMRLLSISDHPFAREIYKAMTTGSEVITIEKVKFKSSLEFHQTNLVESDTVYKVKFLNKSHSMSMYKVSQISRNCSIEEAEEVISSCKSFMIKDGFSGMEFDVFEMISASFGETDFDHFCRETMIKQFDRIQSTRLLELIECNQVIYEMISHNVRKSRMNVGRSSYTSNTVNISISLSSDREILLINNLSSSMSEIKDTCVIVCGDIIDDQSEVIVDHLQKSTEILFVSPDELNWGSISSYKFLSVFSMIEGMSNKDSNHDYCPVYLYLLFMINKMKFSNFAELTRYVTINSTGISNGSYELIKKCFVDDGYKPKTFSEVVYASRLIKMSSFTEILKSSRKKHLILSDFISKNSDGLDESMTRQSIWKIAMPYELSFLRENNNVYNAIYFNKFLYHEHSNVLHREAKTMLNEVSHIKRFLSDYDAMRIGFEHSSEGGRYKPDRTYCKMSILSSICSAHKKLPASSSLDLISDVINRIHPQDYYFDVHSAFTLSRVMNPRGSMSSCDGVCFKNKEYYERKPNGDIVRKGTYKQNSKCWESSLLHLKDFYDDVKPGSITNHRTHRCEASLTKRCDSKDVEFLMTKSMSLFPSLIHDLSNSAQYCSKAVHKNGRGSGNSYREIHVMNAPMRFGCFYGELVARKIRRDQHNLKIMSNVMESKFKDVEAERLYRSYMKMRSPDRVVFFDNADCSKWGPSMLPFMLYLFSAARVTTRNMRVILRAHFTSLGNKIFKIPDKLSEVFKSDCFPKSCLEFKNSLDPSFYNSHCAYLINPQGMGQGLCGNGSGIIQDDCLNLSKRICQISLSDLDPKIDFVSTSDDYSQFFSFLKSKTVTTSSLISRTTYVVKKVQMMLGIERNDKKSTKSKDKSEFNSVFRDQSGSHDAEIKIRSSFIDSFHDYDLAQMSISSLENSRECFNKGLGVIGSAWVHLIGNLLAIKQSSMLQAFRHGVDLYKIPIELGGIIRPDPVRNSSCGRIATLVENYCGIRKEADEDTLRQSLIYTSRVLECFRPGLEEILIEEVEKIDGKVKITVPKTSRSGMVSLVRRKNRPSREIEAFFNSLDQSKLLSSVRLKTNNSIIRCLMTVPKRLEEIVVHSDSCSRLIMPQVGIDKKIYKGNCLFFDGKFSRKDILKKISDISMSQVDIYSNTYHGFELSEPKSAVDINLVLSNLISINNEISGIGKLDFMSNGSHFALCSMNRHFVKTMHRFDFSSDLDRKRCESEFRSEILPISLGGTRDIGIYDYVVSMEVMKSSIIKDTLVEYSIRLPEIQSDRQLGIITRSAICNFDEGTRLVSTFIQSSSYEKIKFSSIRHNLVREVENPQKRITSIVSNIRDRNCFESYRVDITDLVSRYSNLEERNDCIKLLRMIIREIEKLPSEEYSKYSFLINRSFVPSSGRYYMDSEHTLYYEGSPSEMFSSFRMKVRGLWSAQSVVYLNGVKVINPEWRLDVEQVEEFSNNEADYYNVSLSVRGEYICLVWDLHETRMVMCPLCKNAGLVRNQTRFECPQELLFDSFDVSDFCDVIDERTYLARPSNLSVIDDDDDIHDDDQEEETLFVDDFLYDLDLRETDMDIVCEFKQDEISETISGYSASDIDFIASNRSSWCLKKTKNIKRGSQVLSEFVIVTPFALKYQESDEGKTVYQKLKRQILSYDTEDVDFKLNLLRLCFKKYYER